MEFFQNHPFHADIVSDPSKCIPLRVHTDGAKGFSVRSVAPLLHRQFDKFTVDITMETHVTPEGRM